MKKSRERISVSLWLGLLAWIVIPTSAWATLILNESFETDGEGTRYTSATEFKDVQANSYFLRSNGSQTSGQLIPNGLFAASQDRRYALANTGLAGPGTQYTGMDGTWVWAGEDVNGNGSGPWPDPAMVTFNSFTTTLNGRDVIDLEFTGLFGAVLADVGDYLRVSYRLNNGAWVTGLNFTVTNSVGNGLAVAWDTDNNGVGDPGVGNTNMLGKALKPFSFTIPNANTVQIRVEMAANAANDEFGFDHFQITGTVVPEPSTTLLLLNGAALVWFLKRRGKGKQERSPRS